MSVVHDTLKDLFKITSKTRHDSYSDQYNRIFMVKLSLAVTIVMGIQWYKDTITCIIPDAHEIDGGFVSQTCWIQGVYVYKELRHRVDEVAYFGIPKDIVLDGYLDDKEDELCPLIPKLGRLNPHCTPLTKTFYLQYQYLPFLIGALALVFYLPYIAFKSANSDLISLLKNIESDAPDDAKKIAKHYFDKDRRSNPKQKNVFRIICNVLVKLLYIVANLVCFLGLDKVLNGEYVDYGNKWIKWARLENTIMYDYMGYRDHPKPGNVLLPPFGYCEVHASAKDIKESYANKHKFVCELSQHVLYQYALLIFWFALVIGIIVSCLGLIHLLLHYAIGIFGLDQSRHKEVLKRLSFRELEYLALLRTSDYGLYGGVLDELKFTKFERKRFSMRPNASCPNIYEEEIPLDTEHHYAPVHGKTNT